MSAMPSKVASLIQRVKSYVGTHREFFDAVADWYGNAQLAAKFARMLFAKNSNGARVSILVNGHLLAGNTVEVAAGATHLTWMLPAATLTGGENEIGIHRPDSPGPPLYVQSATASAETVLHKQTLDLSSANPAPTPQMELGICTDSEHKSDCWAVHKRGTLTFRLTLREVANVTFSIELYQDKSRFDFCKELLDEVFHRIKSKRREIEAWLHGVPRSDREQLSRLEQQLRDLDAYARLHEAQVRPALTGGDFTTLQDTIARTGNPEQLIQGFEEPLTVVPIEAPPARPQPVLTAQPAPRPLPRRTPPKPVARKGGCFSTLVKFLVVSTLIAGGLGYFAYDRWVDVPDPTIAPQVRIDSPAEGQLVGTTIPLQVWVSGQDSHGVKSLKLSIQEGGDLIASGPTPLEHAFTLSALYKKTGTKVFTLHLRADALVQARNITLVATMVTKQGNTLTTTRNIRVGGREQALMFSINPAEPRWGQEVEVTVHVVNARPGSSVAYKVKGTDGFSDSGTAPIGADGAIRFKVPGAAWGVEDMIDAEIVGAGVRQTATYRFK